MGLGNDQTIQRNYYLGTQISGATAELAVMEGLIWYVLFIIEKRKGGVVLKFVELSYGIGFLWICERRTPLVRLRRLLKNIF